MAVFRKFRAWRPKQGMEKKVASFPYDVLNSEEARALVQNNPYSFLHVVKPEVDLPAGTDLYSQAVYEKARENITRFMEEGILVLEDVPRLYIYRQIMDGREQYGMVGCVSVDDYNKDIIKKHEHTRPKKEEDRTKHVDITNVNAGPIFLTYRARKTIDLIVSGAVKKKPVYDFEADDGISHTVWVMDEEDSNKLIKEFGNIDCLYVADGHHRTASAARVANLRKEANPDHTGDEEYNYFLAVLFPDDQLQILDYNRVLKNLNGHTQEELFNELDKWFVLKKAGQHSFRPRKKGEIGMYLDGTWYELTIRLEHVDLNHPVHSMDISCLQNNLLDPFFGIQNPRTSENIDFVGGIRGLGELKKLVDSKKFRVAFALYPTSIKELMNIADSGNVMPPKSTWFEPKLRSGLLIHSLG